MKVKGENDIIFVSCFTRPAFIGIRLHTAFIFLVYEWGENKITKYL